MKLIDLQPRWLTPDIFIFKSPSGHGDWLSCKRAPWPKKQHEFLYESCPDLVGQSIVGIKKDYCWAFEGNDFATLTVTPSIDASESGNWHGHITNGEIK